ncbi:MAG TPA: disulfide bond formation protein B [Sphingomicrobium sp.]|nr:disulfide bond formation protein B [Sphingomicrobium sp.]
MPGGASRLKEARLLALLIPSLLLGGALFSQYAGGLYPCEMCYWQRWPHAAAIVLAIGAFYPRLIAPRIRMLVLFAAAAVAISGGIGVFHAGVELGWWEGITHCTATGATSLQDILSVPLVRCDQVQWEFIGISMAGWNAIISLAGSAAIVALARKGA